MVDDMGWMDTSVPFYDSTMPLNRRYHTPNMERLAAAGVKFTNAYAQPVCTPSRVSFITGMNAARTRVTNWTYVERNTSSDEKDDQFEPLDWNMNGWSDVNSTPNTVFATPFPLLLKNAGYYTIHVGKAHWGSMGTPGANPLNAGFMVNISGHAGGHPQSYLSEDRFGNFYEKTRPQAVPDLEQYFNTGVFLTEALTLEAIKALRVPVGRHEPFFLNLSQYALHTPIMEDKRFVQKYYESGLDSIESRYAGLVEGMDKSLGDILDFLEEEGISRNTIIIFISDNGGLDHHARGGALNTHNYPLRSGKGSVYEGGIRVPMIVKWPGVAKENTVNDNPVIMDDLFPTILEMAELDTSKVLQTVDGMSLVPVLKDVSAKLPLRPLVFHYPHKWIPEPRDKNLGINYFTAMRYGSWKLIYSMRTGKFQLFDLSKDIREENDLSATMPPNVTELAGLFGKTLRERHAQIPVEKRTGKMIPYPGDRAAKGN